MMGDGLSALLVPDGTHNKSPLKFLPTAPGPVYLPPDEPYTLLKSVALGFIDSNIHPPPTPDNNLIQVDNPLTPGFSFAFHGLLLPALFFKVVSSSGYIFDKFGNEPGLIYLFLKTILNF